MFVSVSYIADDSFSGYKFAFILIIALIVLHPLNKNKQKKRQNKKNELAFDRDFSSGHVLNMAIFNLSPGVECHLASMNF